MSLDLRKLIASGVVLAHREEDFKKFLEIFGDVYDSWKKDAEENLDLLDLDRVPILYLQFLANYLNAEIVRLNLIKNYDFEMDSNGDGLADYWSVSDDPPITQIIYRRKSKAQRVICSSEGQGIAQSIE